MPAGNNSAIVTAGAQGAAPLSARGANNLLRLLRMKPDVNR
jgi:hypothetical protein